MNSLCPASRPAILLQIIIAQSITIQSKAFGLQKVTYPLDQVQKSALFVVQHPLAVNKKKCNSILGISEIENANTSCLSLRRWSLRIVHGERARAQITHCSWLPLE